MIRRRPMMPGRARALRAACRVLVFAAFAVSVACGGGGGGGGGGVTPSLTATFVAERAAPVAGDVSLQPASAAAATFTIDVTFTDIDDVFAATLTLNYDPTVLRFDGSSSAGSFLTAGPSGQRVFEVDESVAGRVRVFASRITPDPGVDVIGTRSLVRLTFRATRATAGTALTLAGNLEVCDSQPDPDAACAANGAIPVSYWDGTATAD